MLLYVEEICALQVRISLRLPGVDGIRVDGGPNFGFGDVIFITFQDAGDRSEFSQHIRDHHVLDLELGRGMNAIDNPGAGGSFRLNQYPNSTSILPTTILKQSFVDGAQYLLLFLSQGDHTSESKAALGIA